MDLNAAVKAANRKAGETGAVWHVIKYGEEYLPVSQKYFENRSAESLYNTVEQILITNNVVVSKKY